MLPTFMIIGAHKAGTTSLAEWLRNHPEAYIPALKEPRFFAFDPVDPVFIEKPRHIFSIRTMSEYEQLFSDSVGHKAVGEASPQYLTSAYACNAIFSALPSSQIVVSLRHPVLRAYSQYWMRVRLGREARTFEDAFSSSEEWVMTSFYYENVKRYVDRFGRSQVLALVFEKLIADPQSELVRLSDYLGIDVALGTAALPSENVGRISRIPALNRLSDNRQLSLLSRKFVPRSVVRVFRSVTSKWSSPTPKLPPDRTAALTARFREDIQRTEDLLQMDLSSHWLR
ncbi:sulfotransferase [Thiocapsa bogorovii]|uniref:sulfotransferase n=1 Tax=Thiocapsa bogorovii TaxID=521689 RepID=UPI001E291ECE|nr:sulfotransferase [Thiocapsa bogorovii]UHD17119.1 sulfotransferase [Thiocapsa bogorovii]